MPNNSHEWTSDLCLKNLGYKRGLRANLITHGETKNNTRPAQNNSKHISLKSSFVLPTRVAKNN